MSSFWRTGFLMTWAFLAGSIMATHSRNRADARLEAEMAAEEMADERAMTLRKLADWWCHAEVERDERVLAMEPPGIGEYARDSWVIFRLGLVPQWPVHDRALLDHLTAWDPELQARPGTNLQRSWEPDEHYVSRVGSSWTCA